MPVRKPRLSELRQLPDTKLVVECDCGAVIDQLGTDWAAEYEAGRLYAGEVRCWRCVGDGEKASKRPED